MTDRTVALPFRSIRPPARPGHLVRFLYKLRPQWFAPRKICAWCKILIARGGIFSRGKVSHGVCPCCSHDALTLARLTRERRHVVGAAFLFFAATIGVFI